MSFARVSANKGEAATLFHARLFTVAPGLRPLFRSEVELQQHQLMTSLAQIVDFHRVGVDPNSYLAVLARGHHGYAAERAHYDAVGDALVFTLAQVLGEDFSPEIRSAWVSVYAEVADAMLRAAEQVTTGTRTLGETQRFVRAAG